MSSVCAGCTCSSPRPALEGSRVLLATELSHTAAALRRAAAALSLEAQVLADGLLAVEAHDVDRFVAHACGELSPMEAAEVRCLVQDTTEMLDASLLARALSAPALAVVAARVQHADLLPLFAQEHTRFHSLYQPIVSLPDRRVIGHEALLRATSPDGTALMPDQLFPAAQAAGWTHVLDRVGRTTALRGAGPWLGDDLLFINFVPTSIYRPEVCLRTTEVAADLAGVRLEQIVFEVTEGHRVTELAHLENVFAYYRSRGCQVALDDLGAGYSSLNLLLRLQPDIVKLDKDIVQGLPGRVSAATVKAIVDITSSYGGMVLAECIETEDQARSATDLGVTAGQGWLFGRPVPGGQVPTAVATQRASSESVASVRVPRLQP